MATTLPSPPATPPPSAYHPSPSSDLAAKLDALLESYLTLLDTYTTLRAQLSRDFASGFLSLAHANRNAASVLGAGRRFGQDGYDERMKAIRGVNIQRVRAGNDERVDKAEGEQRRTQEKQREERPRLRELSNREQGGLDPRENTYPDDGKQNAQHEHRKHNEEDSPKVSRTSNDSQTASSTTEQRLIPALADIEADYLSFNTDDLIPPSTETKSRNPLLWFTALPPQALRLTQSHFTSTICTTIPQLITTISKMKALEKKIWDVRAQMGIRHEYQDEEGGKATDRGETKEPLKSSSAEDSQEVRKGDVKPNAHVPVSQENGSSVISSLASPSKKQGLVARARPSEPRSRVLKMD